MYDIDISEMFYFWTDYMAQRQCGRVVKPLNWAPSELSPRGTNSTIC